MNIFTGKKFKCVLVIFNSEIIFPIFGFGYRKNLKSSRITFNRIIRINIVNRQVHVQLKKSSNLFAVSLVSVNTQFPSNSCLISGLVLLVPEIWCNSSQDFFNCFWCYWSIYIEFFFCCVFIQHNNWMTMIRSDRRLFFEKLIRITSYFRRKFSDVSPTIGKTASIRGIAVWETRLSRQ